MTDRSSGYAPGWLDFPAGLADLQERIVALRVETQQRESTRSTGPSITWRHSRLSIVGQQTADTRRTPAVHRGLTAQRHERSLSAQALRRAVWLNTEAGFQPGGTVTSRAKPTWQNGRIPGSFRHRRPRRQAGIVRLGSPPQSATSDHEPPSPLNRPGSRRKRLDQCKVLHGR